MSQLENATPRSPPTSGRAWAGTGSVAPPSANGGTELLTSPPRQQHWSLFYHHHSHRLEDDLQPEAGEGEGGGEGGG